MVLNRRRVVQTAGIQLTKKKILFYSSDLCFLKYFITLKMLIKRTMPFTWAYIYYWYAYA